jgi:hypothetical protein
VYNVNRFPEFGVAAAFSSFSTWYFLLRAAGPKLRRGYLALTYIQTRVETVVIPFGFPPFESEFREFRIPNFLKGVQSSRAPRAPRALQPFFGKPDLSFESTVYSALRFTSDFPKNSGFCSPAE